MDNEKLDAIIKHTTDRIMTRCRKNVEEEIEALMAAVTLATKQMLEHFCDGCENAKEDTDKLSREEEKSAASPISFEIHTRGVKLTSEDRLALSKMICDFLEEREYLGGCTEAEEEDGDPPEEEEEDGDPPEEEELTGFVERVTIRVGEDGNAEIRRESSEEYGAE